MKNRLLLTAVLFATLGNVEISAAVDGTLSPASKAYQKSRELEEQRRQSIRDKIRESRLRNQQTLQAIESEKIKAETKAEAEASLRAQKEVELATETNAKTEALKKAETEAREKNKLAIISFLNEKLANHAEIIIVERREKIEANIAQALENVARDTTTKYKDQDIETEVSWISSELERAALDSQRKIRKTRMEFDLRDAMVEDLATFETKLETDYSVFFKEQKEIATESALNLFMEKLGWKSTEVDYIERMLREALAEYGAEEAQISQDIKEDSDSQDSEDAVDLEGDLGGN